VDSQLFKSMQNNQHSINCTLAPETLNHYSWSRCFYVNRSLYNFIWCRPMVLFHSTSNWCI